MPQVEQDAIIASRVRQATELANPISATLRRYLYPGSFIISGFDPGTSHETLNIQATDLTLEVNDGNLAVNPPTGRVGTLLPQQTLLMEYGINGIDSHASLLTQEQKELLGSAIVNDVIGTHYVTYRYLGSTANYDFQSPTHDFSDGSLWQRVEPDFITSVDIGVIHITTGETVLVESDQASYGWYKFIGSDRSVSLPHRTMRTTVCGNRSLLMLKPKRPCDCWVMIHDRQNGSIEPRQFGCRHGNDRAIDDSGRRRRQHRIGRWRTTAGHGTRRCGFTGSR